MALRSPPRDDDVREYDPREGEDWFQRLPPAVQARVLATWERERLAFADGPRRQRRRMQRCTKESAILLAGLGVGTSIFLISSFTHLLALLISGGLLGAAAGAVIATAHGGRFTAAVIGAAGFATLHLMVNGFRLDMLGLVCLFAGAWISALVYGIYGVRLEFRGRAHSGED
jgi:hypothetical protein